jgi:hypothetical protein
LVVAVTCVYVVIIRERCPVRAACINGVVGAGTGVVNTAVARTSATKTAAKVTVVMYAHISVCAVAVACIATVCASAVGVARNCGVTRPGILVVGII